jgi:hypothetical protein
MRPESNTDVRVSFFVTAKLAERPIILLEVRNEGSVMYFICFGGYLVELSKAMMVDDESQPG